MVIKHPIQLNCLSFYTPWRSHSWKVIINDEDLLILTGDHGTDPTDGKTDHSREYVPLVAYKNNLRGNNIGERNSFSVIASTISEYFGLENTPRCIFQNHTQHLATFTPAYCRFFSDATLIAHFGATHFTFWIFLWKIM